MLTAILALDVTCGIAFISQASDAAQGIAGVGAGTASGFVGAIGLFNGAGRIFWAALSDKLGRMVDEGQRHVVRHAVHDHRRHRRRVDPAAAGHPDAAARPRGARRGDRERPDR